MLPDLLSFMGLRDFRWGMSPSALVQAMHEANRRMYSRPVLLRKAFLTLCATRKYIPMVFAWGSNVNYRNVALSVDYANTGKLLE